MCKRGFTGGRLIANNNFNWKNEEEVIKGEYEERGATEAIPPRKIFNAWCGPETHMFLLSSEGRIGPGEEKVVALKSIR